MLLYLRTGGGHYAPARAVADVIERAAPGEAEAVLVDGLNRSSQWLKIVLEDGYRFLQARARWYYAFLYFISQPRIVSRFCTHLLSPFVRPALEKEILSRRPESIAIFHFFLIKPVLDILREHALDIPVLVVVTDPFTAHPIWFLEKNLRFAVFSERLKRYCISQGIDESRVWVFPSIVNDLFSRPAEAEKLLALRSELGIPQDEKVVLLIGGKDGIPNGVGLVRAFFREAPTFSVVAVCGEHSHTRLVLERLKRRRRWTKLVILGFTEDVHTLLHLADAVVSKCGASICNEVLMALRPAVVHRYLWGQEKGNVEFLTVNQFGFYEPRTGNVVRRITELLTDLNIRQTMTEKIRAAGFQNGAPLLARCMMAGGLPEG